MRTILQQILLEITLD